MSEIALCAVFAAALVFAGARWGRWKARARAAETRTASERTANDIQNRILLDPAYRERVRREFDAP